MTHRQLMFIDAYCSTLSPAKSARIAGYSPDNPSHCNRAAYHLLNNPKVAAEIDRRLAAIKEANNITPDKLVDKWGSWFNDDKISLKHKIKVSELLAEHLGVIKGKGTTVVNAIGINTQDRAEYDDICRSFSLV